MCVFVSLGGFGQRKNKANLFRIACWVMSIAITNLKKQSQFAGGQNDFKSILTMLYGDFSG
ncbi:MAG: hypothetical protein A2Z38_08025 [Planctomycetes bacterium RBG_19FT_COMBO_48_8]|nr:MAG: hypothetical protein A2Z38_08025 [Planctomycetes bacterium RBG_19FT_COMBO_48_8]